MADINKIMDELLQTTAEDEVEEDVDIYSGRDSNDNDSNALGDNYDRGRDEWDEYEEDEDQWEYQQEYDEWENEMESIDSDYIRRLDNLISTLEDIKDMINDDDHRSWSDERSRIEGMISDLDSDVDSLYSRAEDYRSNPEDW